MRVATADRYDLMINTYTIPRIGNIKLTKLTSQMCIRDSRYSGELTMDEIGQIYGISRMAVSKRLKKLHEKLGSSVS